MPSSPTLTEARSSVIADQYDNDPGRLTTLVERLPPRLRTLLRRPIVGQVLRFGIVGVANTLVYYVLYRLLLATGMPYVVAHLLAWVASVVFSFYANCWFTYRVRPTWRRFIAFPATTLVNVAFTTLGSVLLVSLFSADTRYITVLMGILAIPFTFLVTRMVLVGRDPAAPARDLRGLVGWAAAPVVAGLGAVVANALVQRALGFTPFGEVGRGIGDYGPQYLPFHLYLHDVLSGRALGDASFSWSGGAGTGFLAEYATYLGGPFTLLVGILPLRWMDLSILLVSLLRVGCAAAAMMVLLQMLRPNAPRLAGIALSVGYATSSWVVQLGMTTPQWLDGLLAFPLMCIAAVLTVRQRAVVAPVLLVALGWWSNYYSAMMASIGAAIFLLAWLVATRGPLLRGLRDFAVRGVLGVATAAWMLWPSLRAVQHAAPAASTLMRVQPEEMTLRLFGFTAGIDFPPMLFAGSLVLVTAASVLLAPALAWRARITWAVLSVVAIWSLQWKLAIQLFNGGDVPNGNAYRWSFVLVGLLVLVGWHALTEARPGASVRRGWLTRPQLLLALAVVSLLVWHASGVEADLTWVTHSQWWAGPYTAIAALALLTVLPTGWRAAAELLLVFGVVVELVWSGVIVVPHSRHTYGVSEAYVKAWGGERQQSAKVLATAQWPNYRTGNPLNWNLPRWNTANSPYRLGLPGVSVYASTVPATLESTLGEYGLWAGGRHVYDQPGLLTDTVLSIRARWDNASHSVVGQPVMPMVRTLTRPAPDGRDEVATWAGLFNTDVISAPTLAVRWDDGEQPEVTSEGYAASRPGHKLVYEATCAVGTPSFRTPNLAGKATWADTAEGQQVIASQGQFADGLARPGQALSLSHLSLESKYTPMGLVLCVDQDALAAEVAATPPPATTVEGSRITARFPAPQTGQVLVATTFQDAWSCSADGRAVDPVARGGLLAVPVDGARQVSCVYRTPGLGTGVLVSIVALLATIGLTVLSGRRRTQPVEGELSTPGTAL